MFWYAYQTCIKVQTSLYQRRIKDLLASHIHSHILPHSIWLGGIKKIITPTLSPLVKGSTKPLIPSLIYSASHIKDWPLMHFDASLILLDMRLTWGQGSVHAIHKFTTISSNYNSTQVATFRKNATRILIQVLRESWGKRWKIANYNSRQSETFRKTFQRTLFHELLPHVYGGVHGTNLFQPTYLKFSSARRVSQTL